MNSKDKNRKRCKNYRKNQKTLANLNLSSDSDDNFLENWSVEQIQEVASTDRENASEYDEQNQSVEENPNLSEQSDNVEENVNLVENLNVEENESEEEYNVAYEEDVMNAVFSDDADSTDGSYDSSGEGEGDAEESGVGEGNSDAEEGGIGEVDDELNQNEPREILQLKEWALKKKIKLDALDMLLGILRERLLPTLPKCGKTFLGTTDSSYNIVEMEDSKGKLGHYVYFGIENALKNCVNVDLHQENVIYLQINADGMALQSSGICETWVTSGKIYFDPDIYDVFPIALFNGETKPTIDNYLEDFIDEINYLQREGTVISNRHFDVRLKCFICDTPARSFLKCTLGHAGLTACERCEIEGITRERRTVYPSTEAQERTNESFRSRRQRKHHHRPSPLERIIPHVNMVVMFILDFMHLCCLGVMKKLLEYWLAGDLNYRLGLREREELSRRMNAFYSQIPVEFQRKSRSTKHAAKWKAVEYRFFLLYCGPIALKKILKLELYNHFLLLHAACRILCSDSLCNRYASRAKQYLKSFFLALRDYYGPKSQNSNAHYLIHLADDVTSMGCSLTRITAFPFENYLGHLKNLIRSAYRPLSQLCRRLHEQNFFFKKATIPPLFEILKKKQGRIISIKYKQTKITCASPNNAVLFEDGNIFTVDSMFETPDGIKITGKIWQKKQPIFTYPFNSADHMNMWELESEPLRAVKTVSLNLVRSKLVKLCVSLKINGSKKVYVIPFLH